MILSFTMTIQSLKNTMDIAEFISRHIYSPASTAIQGGKTFTFHACLTNIHELHYRVL